MTTLSSEVADVIFFWPVWTGKEAEGKKSSKNVNRNYGFVL